MLLLDAMILFWSSFLSIGLLGIQSKNVNQSKYAAAGITSLLITLTNAVFVKYMATGTPAYIAIAGLGASCGIMTSIWIYDNVINRKRLTPDQQKLVLNFKAGKTILKKKPFGRWSLTRKIDEVLKW